MNNLKHMPRIGKRDVVESTVIKYLVLAENGVNIGEYDTKIDAFITLCQNSGSTLYKFTIQKLLK